MKTTGALWNEYLASWPEGQWYDDSDETFDGDEPKEADAPALAVVEFSCGVVLDRHNNEVAPLVSHFRKWLKARSHTDVVCDVPKESVEALTAYVKSIGGKVRFSS